MAAGRVAHRVGAVATLVDMNAVLARRRHVLDVYRGVQPGAEGARRAEGGLATRVCQVVRLGLATRRG